MTTQDIRDLAQVLTHRRSEIVLQAFGDHLPMHPAAAIALLSPFFGGPGPAIRLITNGITEGALVFHRDGQPVDGVPETDPQDDDALHHGPRWAATLEAFGAGVMVESKGNLGDAIKKALEVDPSLN